MFQSLQSDQHFNPMSEALTGLEAFWSQLWSRSSLIRECKTASEVEVAWNFCYERPGLYPRAGDITEVLSVVEFGNYFIDQSGVYDKKFQVIMELDYLPDVPTKIVLRTNVHMRLKFMNPFRL